MNLDTETLLHSGWKIGREITDEELFLLKEQSEARRAKEKAFYLLEHRSHSKKELEEKLRRCVSPQAAEQAAQKMQELGLLDDELFARNYAAELLGRKGFSISRARYELAQKGIDKELAEEVTAELAPDPVEKITEILRKKYWSALRDEKGKRRAVAALQRLGYRFEDIRRAIKLLCKNEDMFGEE